MSRKRVCYCHLLSAWLPDKLVFPENSTKIWILPRLAETACGRKPKLSNNLFGQKMAEIDTKTVFLVSLWTGLFIVTLRAGPFCT
jgi:hypothetical protein